MNSIYTRIATAMAAVLFIAGCSGSPGEPPLQGAKIGGPFALTGTDGKTVRDSDFDGKYRLVYFGYTYCPDVCPTDMQRNAKALRLLDKQDPAVAARIVPIFISVDPERDTPAVVKEFVSAFDSRYVGLTGDPKTIADVAREYAVHYEKQPAGPGGGYLVDHVAVTYLMGPKGQPLAFFASDATPEQVAEDVARWAK